MQFTYLMHSKCHCASCSPLDSFLCVSFIWFAFFFSLCIYSYFIFFYFLLHIFAIAINRCSSALSLCFFIFFLSLSFFIRSFVPSGFPCYVVCFMQFYAMVCAFVSLISPDDDFFSLVLLLIPFVLISYSITFAFSASFSHRHSMAILLHRFIPPLLSFGFYLLLAMFSCVKCVSLKLAPVWRI